MCGCVCTTFQVFILVRPGSRLQTPISTNGHIYNRIKENTLCLNHIDFDTNFTNDRKKLLANLMALAYNEKSCLTVKQAKKM